MNLHAKINSQIKKQRLNYLLRANNAFAVEFTDRGGHTLRFQRQWLRARRQSLRVVPMLRNLNLRDHLTSAGSPVRVLKLCGYAAGTLRARFA